MVRVISLFYAAHVVICNKENGSGEIFVGSGALVFFFSENMMNQSFVLKLITILSSFKT